MHRFHLKAETTQYLFRRRQKMKMCTNSQGKVIKLYAGGDTRDSWSGATWKTAVFALRQVTQPAHFS